MQRLITLAPKKAILSAATLAIGLSGCSLAPSPESVSSPEIDFPRNWSADAPAEASYDQAKYWQALNDPVLTELVEAALANNLDIAQAATRLISAREAIDQARASYYPQLSANAGSSRAIGDGSTSAITTSLGLNASWEIDLFGRIGNSVAAARYDYESSGYSLADLQRAPTGDRPRYAGDPGREPADRALAQPGGSCL